MVYIFAVVGLIAGFAIGLGIINVLLRNYTLQEVQQSKSKRNLYGLVVWLCAGLGCWLGVLIYNNYFY